MPNVNRNRQLRYDLVDLDRNQPQQATGQELMEQGLLVTIPDQPGAVLLHCRPMK